MKNTIFLNVEKKENTNSILNVVVETLPTGEVFATLDRSKARGNQFVIHASINTSKKITELTAVVAACRAHTDDVEIELVAGYIPSISKNRNNPSNVNGVYSNVINNLGFTKVSSFDVVSEETVHSINNCVNTKAGVFLFESVKELVKNSAEDKEFIFVSPSLVNSYKVQEAVEYVAKKIGHKVEDGKDLVIETKDIVDIKSGDITGTRILNDEQLKSHDCILVSDVVTDGQDVIRIAKALKDTGNVGDIYLAASHAVFSRGTGELNEVFKKIISTNSFPASSEESTDLVTRLEVSKFL